MDSDQELRVVHALRLKGFADTSVIAEAAAVTPTEAAAALDALAANEQARYREGRMTGWMLLPAGRSHGEAMLAAELDAAGKRAEVDAAYRRFLEHNQAFLALCTDWQVRTVHGEQAVNDHSDASYDAAVVGRLGDMDEQVQMICADLAAMFPRFASYGPRFAAARANVEAGDTQWFTKPVIESYHTVWFELHEDLLASLGIERSEESHS